MSVIKTKLFTESDNRTVLRPENMENVLFYGVFHLKSHGV